MKKLNEFFDKLFRILPGYYFGLISFIITILGIIFALLFSPEYAIWRLSISMLAIYTGGWYLRIAWIISGFITIPFYVYFGRVIKNDTVNDLFLNVSISIGIFSTICVSFLGIFSGANPLMNLLHGMFVLFCWLANTVFFIGISLILFKTSEFPKIYQYLTYIVAGYNTFFLIPFFITNFCSAFPDICYSFGQMIYTVMPISEWIMYFLSLFWIFSFSCYMLYKKN